VTDLNHKRRQCRAKADENLQTWVIFTRADDFEPKTLCDMPESMLSMEHDIDVIERVYPRVAK